MFILWPFKIHFLIFTGIFVDSLAFFTQIRMSSTSSFISSILIWMPLFLFLVILHWLEPTANVEYEWWISFWWELTIILMWVCLVFMSSVSSTVCRLTGYLIYWSHNIAQTKGPILKQRKCNNRHMTMRFTSSVSYCMPAWKSDELLVMVPNRKWYWRRIGCYLQEFSIRSKSMTIIQCYVFSWWNTWVQEPRNRNRNGPDYLIPIIPSDLLGSFAYHSQNSGFFKFTREMAKVPLNSFFQGSFCQGTSWQGEKLLSW